MESVIEPGWDLEADLLVRCEVCGDIVVWPDGVEVLEDGTELCKLCAGLCEEVFGS